MSKPELQRIQSIYRRLNDIDCELSAIVTDYQEAAESGPDFESHDKNDKTGEPVCLPEDANPELDGVRVFIYEAMRALHAYRPAHDKRHDYLWRLNDRRLQSAPDHSDDG